MGGEVKFSPAFARLVGYVSGRDVKRIDEVEYNADTDIATIRGYYSEGYYPFTTHIVGSFYRNMLDDAFVLECVPFMPYVGPGAMSRFQPVLQRFIFERAFDAAWRE